MSSWIGLLVGIAALQGGAPVQLAPTDGYRLVWEQFYSAGFNVRFESFEIEVDGQGSVLQAGWRIDASGTDFLTIKYDAGGQLLWQRTLDLGFQDRAKGLEVDGQGNAYVSGTTDAGYTSVKYDPAGNELWVRTQPLRVGPSGARDMDSALDAAGNLYLVGTRTDSSLLQDALVFAYDPTGNLLWMETYDAPASLSDAASRVALDAAGLSVTGATQVAGGDFDVLTLRYDLDGDLQWARTYGGAGGAFDQAAGIALDPSGNTIVAGRSGPDALALAYDPRGNPLWEYLHPGPEPNRTFTDVAADGTGSYCTGFTIDGTYGLFTLKFSPSGRLMWETSLGKAARPERIAVDPRGTGVVVGSVFLALPNGPGGTDMLVLAHDSLGRITWSRQHMAPFSARALQGRDVEIDPSANVCTGGTLGGPNQVRKLVSTKYAPDLVERR